VIPADFARSTLKNQEAGTKGLDLKPFAPLRQIKNRLQLRAPLAALAEHEHDVEMAARAFF